MSRIFLELALCFTFGKLVTGLFSNNRNPQFSFQLLTKLKCSWILGFRYVVKQPTLNSRSAISMLCWITGSMCHVCSVEYPRKTRRLMFNVLVRGLDRGLRNELGLPLEEALCHNCLRLAAHHLIMVRVLRSNVVELMCLGQTITQDGVMLP